MKRNLYGQLKDIKEKKRSNLKKNKSNQYKNLRQNQQELFFLQELKVYLDLKRNSLHKNNLKNLKNPIPLLLQKSRRYSNLKVCSKEFLNKKSLDQVRVMIQMTVMKKKNQRSQLNKQKNLLQSQNKLMILIYWWEEHNKYSHLTP